MNKIRCGVWIVNQLTKGHRMHMLSRPIFTQIANKQGFSLSKAAVAPVPIMSRRFSSGCPPPDTPPLVQIAQIEEVEDLPNHPEKLLIDVREPHELAETGRIPTSINIPLGTLGDELKLSAASFLGKYGRELPDVDQEIIFSCKSGVRAEKGAILAQTLGFKNVKNYKGSWTEWAEKHKKSC